MGWKKIFFKLSFQKNYLPFWAMEAEDYWDSLCFKSYYMIGLNLLDSSGDHRHPCCTAKWIQDRSKFSSNKPKTWRPIACWFLCFTHSYLFWAEICFVLILEQGTGKNTEINKQADIKFWFNWRSHGAVSYLLSCIVH